MILHVLQLDTNNTIKLWDLTKEDAIAQEFKNGYKSKKSKCKIHYYNEKPFIKCCGHRYYIEQFTKVEL